MARRGRVGADPGRGEQGSDSPLGKDPPPPPLSRPPDKCRIPALTVCVCSKPVQGAASPSPPHPTPRTSVPTLRSHRGRATNMWHMSLTGLAGPNPRRRLATSTKPLPWFPPRSCWVRSEESNNCNSGAFLALFLPSDREPVQTLMKG